MSGVQPGRIGSGSITSRSSMATSIEASDPGVSRNATSECVNASSARVRSTVIGSPNTSSRSFTGNGVVSSTTTWPGRVIVTVEPPVSTAADERR
ncbi:hypothetical protein ACFWMQ_26950 [Streptomyces sp. NPDC058372]|uniref:hypothetical protein n=1 Tax=Streptomyces sp. NPDC058372 TaxID=3346464 RepID=UPI00365BF38F